MSMGKIIDGKYEILKQIGKGGMSTVFLAMDLRLNKQWAIKEIRRSGSDEKDQVVVSSLLAEAGLMKKLDHPALPRIVDIIETDQTIFVVMDYIEGESLDRVLYEMGPQPQEMVLDWAKQLCDALWYLHRQKPPIIYRDMKPANIMVKPEGNIKLIDFGIAREYKEANLADTTILGTKGYAPPEQHGKRQTDARSDIYALGMTMHHLLTGADPRSPDYMYLPIRHWNPQLSSGLERVIDKATALDPEQRYQNCGELLYGLEHYEQEDESYRRRQRAKVHVFAACLTAGLLSLGVSGLGYGLGAAAQEKDYENKIGISAATPYEARISSYLEAIDLDGTDPRAYLRLIEAYKENEKFGDVQSQEFVQKFNSYKEEMDFSQPENQKLLYETGLLYFYLYSGGDNSFRSRLLKSHTYFSLLVDQGEQALEAYPIAESYKLLGEFYKGYVIDTTSVKEPTKETYDVLLAALEVCMDNLEEYKKEDAAYIRLSMYKEIANLLNAHRKGLAACQVEQAKVESVYAQLSKDAEALSVTQQISLDLQEDVLEGVEMYMDNLRRTYSNTEQRSGE